jgi:hypothetical protein
MYEGIKYTQTKHAIFCKRCLDTIESKFVNDFKWCSCESVGVGGGIVSGILFGTDFVDKREWSAIVSGRIVYLSAETIRLLNCS